VVNKNWGLLMMLKKNLIKYNDLIDQSFLALYEQRTKNELSAQHFEHFPIRLLNISVIFETVSQDSLLKDEQQELIINKLIDIKSLFFFLDNSMDRFYLGAFEIIGNGELEKADERTISWLQLTHYKVYLISSLYEKLVDVFEIIYLGSFSNAKKNKIGKKLEKLWQLEEFDLVTKDENDVLTNFRDTTRRGEIHGTSSVLRQLLKDEWNHLSIEEGTMRKIIERFYTKFNSRAKPSIQNNKV
jgi:hypothetical protein